MKYYVFSGELKGVAAEAFNESRAVLGAFMCYEPKALGLLTRVSKFGPNVPNDDPRRFEDCLFDTVRILKAMGLYEGAEPYEGMLRRFEEEAFVKDED